QRNLYVRDLTAGVSTLVTANPAGTDGGDNASYAPALSADGRVVAFESTADNLAAGDGNRNQDVLVRDTAAGRTAIASVRTPLLPAERISDWGGTLQGATSDGRYVVFTAAGNVANYQPTDAVPGVTIDPFSVHVFVRDRQTGAVRVVDVTPDGKTAPNNAFAPSITPDGRYVVFLGQSAALVPGIGDYAATGETMAFERDLQTGVTQMVSVNPAGTHDVNVAGGEVAVSADGRYVVFTSADTSAVAGLTNPNKHRAVFLRDMQTGTTVLVSHN